MQIDQTKWDQLRQAAAEDDQARFRALVWLLVRAAVREDAAVRQAGTPFSPDGRPWLASCR